MRSSDLSRATWRKSSRSNDGVDGNCVEIAELPDRIALRDSKDPTGPVLAFPPAEWRAFVVAIQTSPSPSPSRHGDISGLSADE